MYDFLGQQQPPKNIKVYSTDNRITIIRKWNFYINYGNLFLIIPPSIGLVMYVFELIQKYTLEKLIKDFIEVFFFSPFPIPFIATICTSLAFYIPYLFLAKCCNKTYITADREKLLIRHRPIPWKNQSFQSHILQDIYVEKLNNSPHTPKYTCCLLVISPRGTTSERRRILNIKNKIEEPLFIKNVLKEYYFGTPESN